MYVSMLARFASTGEMSSDVAEYTVVLPYMLDSRQRANKVRDFHKLRHGREAMDPSFIHAVKPPPGSGGGAPRNIVLVS